MERQQVGRTFLVERSPCVDQTLNEKRKTIFASICIFAKTGRCDLFRILRGGVGSDFSLSVPHLRLLCSFSTYGLFLLLFHSLEFSRLASTFQVETELFVAASSRLDLHDQLPLRFDHTSGWIEHQRARRMSTNHTATSHIDQQRIRPSARSICSRAMHFLRGAPGHLR